MVGRCKKFSLQQCFCLLTRVLNSIISAWIRRFLYWAWRKENPSPLKCHRNRVAELSQILFEYLGGLLTKTILFNPNSFNLVHYQHALPLCLCSQLGLLCSSRWVTELGLTMLEQTNESKKLFQSLFFVIFPFYIEQRLSYWSIS